MAPPSAMHHVPRASRPAPRAADWTWARPPDEELRRLARGLELGRLPDDAEPVKRGRTRGVWRAPRTGGGLIVKHFLPGGWEWLRSPVWPSRAAREYRVMEEFCRLGLPTVRPIACGERRGGGFVSEAWFLGRLVPGAATLAEALAAAPDDEARRRLACRALQVVAELHRHPYRHRDLHAGNLLLDEAGALLVIDLHSVWRQPRPTDRARLAMLGRLLHSMRETIDLSDLRPLVEAYAEAAGRAAAPLLPRVARALQRFEDDHVRGRAARCLRNSSRFTHGRTAEGHLWRRREYEPGTLAADLAGLAAAGAGDRPGAGAGRGGDDEGGRGTSGPAPTLLNDAPRTRVVLSADRARVVKEYRERGPLAALRGALGLGRGRAPWTAGERLAVLGIPTARTLALLERRDGSAVLVTEAVAGDTLRRRLRHPPEAAAVPGGPAATPTRAGAPERGRDEGADAPRDVERDPALRHALARSLGWVVGRLSRAGLCHADLSAKNWLVADHERLSTGGDRRLAAPAGLPRVVLIDLDGLRRTRPHDDRALARMLGQLGDLPGWATAADRLRFARALQAAAGRPLPAVVAADAAAAAAARRRRREAQRHGAARAGRALACLVVAALGAFTGDASAHDGDHARLAALHEALAAAPADAALWVRLADAHRDRGEPAAAWDALERAARLAPDHDGLALRRARLLADAGALADALREVERALAARDDDGAAHRLRARVLSRLARHDEAADAWDAAIARLSPPSPDDVLERLAAVRAGGGPDAARLARAAAGLDEGLRRLGPATAIVLAAVDLDLERGEFDRALRRLDEVTARSARPEPWLLHRGRVLAAAGRTAEARAAWTGARAALAARPRPTPADRDLDRDLASRLARLDRGASHD